MRCTKPKSQNASPPRRRKCSLILAVKKRRKRPGNIIFSSSINRMDVDRSTKTPVTLICPRLPIHRKFVNLEGALRTCAEDMQNLMFLLEKIVELECFLGVFVEYCCCESSWNSGIVFLHRDICRICLLLGSCRIQKIVELVAVYLVIFTEVTASTTANALKRLGNLYEQLMIFPI